MGDCVWPVYPFILHSLFQESVIRFAEIWNKTTSSKMPRQHSLFILYLKIMRHNKIMFTAWAHYEPLIQWFDFTKIWNKTSSPKRNFRQNQTWINENELTTFYKSYTNREKYSQNHPNNFRPYFLYYIFRIWGSRRFGLRRHSLNFL